MLWPHAPKRLGFLLQQCEMLQAVCVAPWSSPGERDVDGRGSGRSLPPKTGRVQVKMTHSVNQWPTGAGLGTNNPE